MMTTGNSITVNATGTKAGYTPLTLGSAPTRIVAHGTLTGPIPVLENTQPLYVYDRVSPTFDTSRWPSGTTFQAQWHRSGVAIAGATDWTYLLLPEDAGKTLTLGVTASKFGYETATAESAASTTVLPRPFTLGTPVVTGTAKVGFTLAIEVPCMKPYASAPTVVWPSFQVDRIAL